MVSTRFPSVFARLSFLVAALFCFSPASSFAADNAAGPLAFTVSVPQTVSVQQAHDVVVSVSRARKWIVKEDAPDHVVIYLNHRGVEATVTYTITGQDVNVYCDAYKVDSKGAHVAPTQATRWLKYLHEDITARIAKLAAQAK